MATRRGFIGAALTMIGLAAAKAKADIPQERREPITAERLRRLELSFGITSDGRPAMRIFTVEELDMALQYEAATGCVWPGAIFPNERTERQRQVLDEQWEAFYLARQRQQ